MRSLLRVFFRALSRASEGFLLWVEDRSGALSALRRSRKLILKPVPRGLSWAYTLGSLAMFLFTVQLLTGFLLLIHYVPDAAGAYRSVQEIQHRVNLGWLVRQMHSWGASFLVAALIFHMLKVLWYGGYKRPREITWFLGVFLLFVTLGFCFTGYLLPWNQLARWATAVGTDAVVKLPVVGNFLGNLVRGGPEVSGQTLGRFFAVHVFILPVALTALLLLHLSLVQKHGISTHLPVSEERALGYPQALERAGGAEPFFPRQLYRDLLVVNLGFAALVCAAAFWPWELGPPAGETTPPGIKPEWYFLPVYQFLKYFDSELVNRVPLLGRMGVSPELFGILIVNLAGAALVLLPILDRGNQRRITRRPVFALLAAFSLALVAGLGVLGHYSGRTVSFFGTTYRVSAKGYPEKVVPEGISSSGAPGAAALAASTAQEGAAPPSAGSDPAGAAAGQCGACHRHEKPLKDWKLGVHARGPKPASACKDCHGGDPSKSDKDEAHAGMLTKKIRGTVRARKPEDEEVVEVCGKCHGEVQEAFSKDHLGLEPKRACSFCHTNHKVLPAGLATFEKGYRDEDPRAERFQAIRRLALELDDQMRLDERVVADAKERLHAHEAPIDDLEEDLVTARELARKSRVLTHSLDPQAVQKATAAAVEGLRKARIPFEERILSYERRKRLAAAVGTVSLAFAAMLALALRRLRGRPAPPSPPPGPPLNPPPAPPTPLGP